MSQQIKKREILEYVLTAVGAFGIVSIAIVAPNLLTAFQIFLPKNKYKKSQISNSVNYLKRSKLIKENKLGDKIITRITRKGLKRLRNIHVNNINIPIPQQWDGKWRLVVFDISERTRSLRLAFTNKLKRLGFYKLQKSVFVHPFPCKDQVEKLANHYKIRTSVSIMTIEELDVSSSLAQIFNL